MKKYSLHVTFTEPVLGSIPLDGETYGRYIAPKRSERIENPAAVAPPAEPVEEEVNEVAAEEVEQRGATGFHMDQESLYFFDYVVKGFLSEAARAIKPERGTQASITQRLFVYPRKLRLLDEKGKLVREANEVFNRPLRAMTPKGPRVSLVSSELLPEGTSFAATIAVIPAGEKDLTPERLHELLDYGALKGIGQFRGGSFGRFNYVLQELDESNSNGKSKRVKVVA